MMKKSLVVKGLLSALGPVVVSQLTWLCIRIGCPWLALLWLLYTLWRYGGESFPTMLPKIDRIDLNMLRALDELTGKLLRSKSLSDEGVRICKRIAKACGKMVSEYEEEAEKRRRAREIEKYGKH